MIILGLTGSIGMGKSTTAQMFAELGIPVYDADAAVHELYQNTNVVSDIEKMFPGSTKDNRVDRSALGKIVLNDLEKMRTLEEYIHPLVQKAQNSFIRSAKKNGEGLVVLDIPLLFEKNKQGEVDKVLVVTAPEEVQRQRVLSRPGMTKERFNAIVAKQTSDTEKRRLADYIIDTSKGLDHARTQVKQIVDELTT